MKLFFITVWMLASIAAYCQEPSFNWGMALPKTAKQQKVKIFGAGNPVYYVVTESAATTGQFGATYTIEAFKSNHDRVFVKEITPTMMFDVGGFAFINNKVVLFTYGFVKDQGGDILMATSYDLNNQGGDKQQLGRWNVDKMGNRGRFRVTQSTDLKYILIGYEPDWRKGENEQLQLVLYNSSLNVVWQTTQTLPYQWKRGVNNNYFINNQGTAFILKRTVADGEDNHYSLLSYHDNKLEDHALEPGEGKKIVSIITTIAENGTPVIGGYYTEDKKVHIGSTTFYGNFLFVSRADGSGAPDKYVQAFEDKRKDMQLKYLYAEQDRYIILGQEERVSSSISPDREKAMKGEYDYKYFVHDIYADAFDLTGKHVFSSKVHRDLDSKNDYGISNGFFAAVMKDSLYIIFNDEESRYDRKRMNVVFFGDPLLPILVAMSTTTGEMAKPLPLFNSGGVGGKRAEMRMRPDVFERTDAANYLMRGENNELFKMGSIKLE